MTNVPILYIWMEFWLQNFNFAHIWSCGDLDLSHYDLKFSEILKFLSGIIEWNYKLQNIFLSIFGHVVTLTCDVQLSEMLYPTQYVFFIDKNTVWYIWMELRFKNCIFAHIWSCGVLDLWILDLKYSEILNSALISASD